MKANGIDVIEIISIGPWAILEFRKAEYNPEQGSGVSHLECESWTRYEMDPNQLHCRNCKMPMSEEIVTVWLLLNSDTFVGRSYYERLGGADDEVR